jgi:hypothetical protein
LCDGHGHGHGQDGGYHAAWIHACRPVSNHTQTHVLSCWSWYSLQCVSTTGLPECLTDWLCQRKEERIGAVS